MMPDVGKWLVVFGAVLLGVGVALQYGVSFPFPWLSWIGHLPGDFEVSFSRFRLLLPLGSCLAISLVLTLILHFLSRR